MKHLKRFNETHLNPARPGESGDGDSHGIDMNVFSKKESDSDIDVRNPKFSDKDAEKFLTRLGIKLSPSTDRYPTVHIRKGGKIIMYGFKNSEDKKSFQEYLDSNDIKYENPRFDAEGAVYPHQVIIRN